MFKRYGWIPLVLIPVGAIAGLLVAAVITYIMPKIYESQAVIEVRPFADTPIDPPRGPDGEGEAPGWVLAEIEKMKSRPILEKVSQNLDLPNRWNLAAGKALPILKNSLDIQSMRGTNLVSIRVRHTNKVDARDIADEMTKAYKAYRDELAARDSEKLLHELNKAVRDQEDKVEERRKVLATIVRTKGIIYRGPESGVDDHKSATQTYHGLEQEKMQLEAQISSLLKYENDQLMVYAAGLDLPENIIRNLYPLYLQAKRDLEATKINGLDHRHPTVIAKVDEIENMKKQLDEGVGNLRATLKAKLDLASERLKQAEAMKESSDQANNRAMDAQDYVDAKREFESDQELLQSLKLKLVGESITTKLGRDRVLVHEQPVVSESPVSPKVTFNLVLGTISGAILFPLLGLPLMWSLNRRRNQADA